MPSFRNALVKSALSGGVVPYPVKTFGAEKPEKTDVEQNIFQLIRQALAVDPPQRDAATLLDLYNTNPWVRSIVGRIGDLVGATEWLVASPAGEIDEHPALAWLKSGNPEMPGETCMSLLQVHLDLAGEGYIVVGRDKGGRPASWAVIAPHEMEYAADLTDPLSRYQVRTQSGDIVEYAQLDVIKLKQPDPRRPYKRGRSLTGALQVELEADENAAEYVRAFMKNRGVPELLISGTKDAPIQQKDLDTFAAKWRQLFSGVKKAGRPFFSSRPVEAKELGGKLRENAMVEIRQEMRAIITETYGVPPEIFGRLDNSNRATVDAASYLMAVYTLIPRLKFIVRHVQPFLRREGLLGAKETLSFESPAGEDKQLRLEVMKAKPDAFSVNEWRGLAGLPATSNAADDALSGPQSNPTQNANENENALDVPKRLGDNRLTKSVSPDEIIEVASAHQAPYVKASVTALLDGVYKRLIERYGIGLLTMLELDANFQASTATFEWLQREIPKAVDLIDATTAKAVSDALTSGVVTNATREALVFAIDGVFEDAIAQRSGLIGQTEATKLAGFASVQTSKQAGFERKMWLDSGDQVVRDTHDAMNGQIVGIDEDFRSPSGAHGPHPGALGRASEDVNCRCASRPIIDGEEVPKNFETDFKTFHDRALKALSSEIQRAMVNIFQLQRDIVRKALEARVFL